MCRQQLARLLSIKSNLDFSSSGICMRSGKGQAKCITGLRSWLLQCWLKSHGISWLELCSSLDGTFRLVCIHFQCISPSGFWKNVTIPADRAVFQWLFLMVWELFISTFAQFICSFVPSSFVLILIIQTPNAPTAAMITSLLFSLTLIFAGVFQPLANLISFWHWM